MTYIILPSKRFRKAANTYAKGGRRKVLDALAEAIELLTIHDERSLLVLSTHWRDHELKGNKKGIRELHVGQDELLLYAIDRNQHIVKLLDIVSHEDLRKQ